MTEIKAGDNWLGNAESPLAVKVDFVGDRYVVASSELAGEFTMLKATFVEVYHKVEPFYEVGKVYADENYFFAVKAVWSEDGKKFASGWEWPRSSKRASGWTFAAETMEPNGSTHELWSDDKD